MLYIVVKIRDMDDYAFSFAPADNPHVHTNQEAAKKEATRLCEQQGSEFAVFGMTGRTRRNRVEWVKEN